MTTPHFTDAESPEHPGWRTWSLTDPTRFNTLLGPLLFRLDGEIARVRMLPEHRHSNLRDAVHGGALLGFIDVALFAAARGHGLIVAGTAVTLALDTQFIGAARIGEAIEAQVELLKETGRLLFLRGLVVQGETKVAAFSATIRKPSKGRIRFYHPGGGRGPIGKRSLVCASPRHDNLRNWAPASAGVVHRA